MKNEWTLIPSGIVGWLGKREKEAAERWVLFAALALEVIHGIEGDVEGLDLWTRTNSSGKLSAFVQIRVASVEDWKDNARHVENLIAGHDYFPDQVWKAILGDAIENVAVSRSAKTIVWTHKNANPRARSILSLIHISEPTRPY